MLGHRSRHRERIGLEPGPLAQMGQRPRRVGGVDLAPQPVAVPDRVGQKPRGDAVADAVDALDAGAGELQVEALVRDALGHEHDGVGLELELLAELGLGRHAAGLDPGEPRLGPHADAEVVQVAAKERALERLVAQRGDLLARGHELDLVAVGAQELGHARAHEVALAVEHQHARAGRALALEHHLLGREDVRQGRVGARDRAAGDAVSAVAGPLGSGRDHDQIGPGRAHPGRIQAHAGLDLDVRELGQLSQPPGAQPVPLGQAGQARDPAGDAARLLSGVDQAHAPHPPAAEHERALHPRRAGPHHQHLAVGVCGGVEPLGVPAAAVLLAGGRVLGAADVAAEVALRDAHVAADAGADVVDPARADLLGQERVGDVRAGRADQVPHARLDDLGHPLGRRQPADADDRLPRRLAHVPGPLELPALGEEARRARVLRPLQDRADVDVPQVDQVVGHAHELEAPRRAPRRGRPPPTRPPGRRSRSRSRPRRGRPAASRSTSGRGSRASRRRRRCAGCRTARASARAGRSGRRRRRRCRTRRRASGSPHAPSPRRCGRCRAAPSPSG